MSKAKSGGGIRMNKNVSVKLKTGKPAKGLPPAAAADIGRAGAARITSTGPAINKPMGNELAKAGGQGPGAGRTVMPTGTQGQHGGKAR